MEDRENSQFPEIEDANVPVYVLEFLLGQFCSSDDPKIIEDGVKNVKRILAENFVRPDEAQKVLSSLRERGSYSVIDRITVSLNTKVDRYEADFSNLGVRGIPISPEYPSKYDRLLCGGIWCIIGLEYEYIEEEKKSTPIRIIKLTPIQMPHIDMEEIKNGRRAFSKDEWITVLLRSTGMEFYDVNFSYIDNESFEERYVTVPEQGGGKIIPEGLSNPGNVYTISRGKSGMIGVFRLETQMLPGSGKFERTGLTSDRDARESANTAFNFLKANGRQISGTISTTTKDYIVNYQDLNGIGMTKYLTLPTVIALASCALGKPTLSSLAVLGEISIGGTIQKVEELASVLQVCLDSGAKKVLIPITSATELGTVPADLIGAFSLIFYSTPHEAVFKALGVE